jgi:hypothetical protein
MSISGPLLPSKADVSTDVPVGRRCAKTGHEQMQQTLCANARLLDHLVGEHEQRGRKFPAQRLGSLQVDGQYKLCRKQDG